MSKRRTFNSLSQKIVFFGPRKARQHSEKARLENNKGWHWRPETDSWPCSRSFGGDKDACVRNALNHGYGVVLDIDGTVIARK